MYEQLNGRVEVVGPDTYILLDSKGNPQPVLNMTYEEYRKLLEQEKGKSREGASGDYTPERLVVEGELKPSYAQFTATMEIKLHTSEPVEVPLRFMTSIPVRLPELPRRSDGRSLEFVPEKGGWVATLQGQPGEKVTIELEFMSPLQRDGDRSRLRLLAPRSIVGELRLESPATIESPIATENVVVETEPLGDGGGTRIVARGIGGEFTMSWEEQREEATESAAVLSSMGQVRSHIDGSNVRTTALLTVSSLGAMFDTFRIRLPEGDEYISYEELPVAGASEGEGLVSSVEETTDEAGGRVYVVKLAKETKGPVKLSLSTTRPLERRDEGESAVQGAELEGFEVLGAVRQDGEIALAVADQLQMSLSATDNLQQIDLSQLATSTAGGTSRDQFTTAYRYYSQPYQLRIDVAKRERGVNATTKYKLTLRESEALLTMTVNYVIKGVSTRELPIGFPLGFDLGKWELANAPIRTQSLENATPEVPVDSFGDDQGRGNRLAFPYASATNVRDVQIELNLRRDLRVDEPLELELPFVDGDVLAAETSLNVDVEPGLLLTPDTRRMVGLAAKPIDDLSVPAPGTQLGQLFEYRGFEPRPVFAGSLRKRAQRVTATARNTINVVDRQAHVTQEIAFDIRHQPLEEIALVIPSEIMGRDDLRLSWSRPNGAAATSSTSTSTAALPEEVSLELPLAEETSTAVPEVRIPLTRPQFGRMNLYVRYSLDAPAVGEEGTWIVPLATPLEAELEEQEVILDNQGAQIFSPVVRSQWQTVEDDESATAQTEGTRFVCHEAINYLPLAPRRVARSTGVTDIDRIWLQTWLTQGVVQQRLAVQFRSSESRVVVELPQGLSADEVVVAVDGIPVPDVRTGTAQLEVPLAGGGEFRSRVIELRYRQPHQLGWMEQVAFEAPRVAGDDRRAEMFWQVVTPTNLLALEAPEASVEAYTCRWSEGDWRAEGDLSTQELESWVGVAPRQRPTLGEHALLWRSSPQLASLKVRLVRRELVVLVASSVVLALGLTLLYVPALRRRGVWLTLAVVIAALGVSYPATARLLAQAGLLGGLATAVAVALATLARRPEVEPSVGSTSPASPSSIVTPPSRGSSIAPLGGGNYSTNAPTVSVELSDAPS